MADGTEDQVRRAQLQYLLGPQPGERYRHYKGGTYQVICRSVKEDTLEPLVTYRSEQYGYIWTRTLANWSEMVDGQPRFQKVEG